MTKLSSQGNSKQTISKTDTVEFTNWCFTERHKFSEFLLDSLKWFDMPAEQRVKIENFLICFDQLLDRQSQQAALCNTDTSPQHSYLEQGVIYMLEALKDKF